VHDDLAHALIGLVTTYIHNRVLKSPMIKPKTIFKQI
jgi:hypothetical protein